MNTPPAPLRPGPGIWVLAFPLMAVLAVILLLAPGSRSWLASAFDGELRHTWVAVTSRVGSRPVDTADHVMVSPRVDNPLGVNVFLEQEVEVEKRRRTLEMVRAAGIQWIRQQFPWEEIEPVRKGEYVDPKFGNSTWEKYDNIVDLAEEYGLSIIARLDTSPRWAHPGNAHAFTPPDRLDDYGDFVYAVVRRYRGRVRYYQVWNEPNLHIEWGLRPVNASEYVSMLKVAATRAREADPDAVILSAALSPTLEQSPMAMNELLYLQEMYDAGAAPYFDIMAVQAYGLRNGPDDRRLNLQDVNFSRPMLVREIMVRNGDASKPIWASEMGWNAMPPDLPGEARYGRVTEDQQARFTVRGFERARQEWPWMGVMAIWFFKRADDHEADQDWYYFRMLDPDFTPHPVYYHLQAYARERGYIQPAARSESGIPGSDGEGLSRQALDSTRPTFGR